MHRRNPFFLFLIMLSMFLSSCIFPENPVRKSLGEYSSYEFYSDGGFQDFTDYGKYHYDSVNLSDNPYFKKFEASDWDPLNEHLDNFEQWVDTIRRSDPSQEVAVHYDFDRSIIDLDDYLYIESEKHTWSSGYTALVNYTIYFFDTQTNTLFYFHNNI